MTRRRLGVALLAVALTLAVGGGLVGVVSAGADYTILQCGGSPAPVWISGFGGTNGGLARVDNCQQGGGGFSFAQNPGTVLASHVSYGAAVAIPSSMPDLGISHLDMQYALAGDLGPNLAFFQLNDSSDNIVDQLQVASTPSAGVIDVPMDDSRVYWIWIACSNSANDSGCNMTGQDVMSIGATAVTVHDNSVPQVAASGGTLLSGGPEQGVRTLAFTAADDDSGVKSVTVSLGSQQAGAVNYSSRCVFTQFNPCPATVADVAQVDTTTVADGVYPVLVTATSASGQSTTGQAGVVRVSNGTTSASLAAQGFSPSNGNPASASAQLRVDWARTSRPVLDRSPYDRSQLVRGSLKTLTGQPIADATVLVRATPAYGGAKSAAAAGQVQTATNGTFAYRAPAQQSSRVLTFSYEPQLGRTFPVVTAQVSLGVAAPVRVNVEPRISEQGGTITFSGQLAGGPIPNGGKQLTLEARQVIVQGRHLRSVGAWVTFRALRASARGRFRARYRFRLAGPVDYEFRAVSAAERDYPYEAGVSRPVVVHER